MKERIMQALQRALDVDVNESCSQNTCKEWDSMRHLNVVIELEMEFGVEFTPEEIAEMISFDDIVRVLNTKL